MDYDREGLKEFDALWKAKEQDKARFFAKQYLADNLDYMSRQFSGLTIEQLVDWVTSARNNGREENRILADIWLLAVHPPQNIVGSLTLGR